MKYFVIGTGSIGKRHTENLSMLGANVINYPWREIDLESLIEEIRKCNGSAAVVISTSTNVRMPLIEKCASAGASLYIEKPVAYRSSDIDKIYRLPKEILERSVAGFMMRYHPIIRMILDQKIENIYRANFEVGYDVNRWRTNWIFSRSYASDPNGGGVLLDLCHEIDLAQLLCGPAPLTGVNSISHPKFGGIDIASTLGFSSQDGRNYQVSMDYLAPAFVRRGSILGTDIKIEYDIVQEFVSITSRNNHRKETLRCDRNKLFLDAMKDFMALAEGYETQNMYIPRLDKVKDVCHLISEAWQRRNFKGTLEADLK